MDTSPDGLGPRGRIALYALPEPIRFTLYAYFKRQKRRESVDWAINELRLPLQEGVELCVYWMDSPVFGGGPGASLYVLGDEVLRLDCFAGDMAHMHLNPSQQNFATRMTARLYFPYGSQVDHVERAAFELVANTDAALKSNRLKSVFNFQIDRQALIDASGRMKDYMKELLERHSPTEP